MLLNFEAKAKSLRPRQNGPEAEAEARDYKAETKAEAKLLASRPVSFRDFNILLSTYNKRSKQFDKKRLMGGPFTG